MLSSFMAFSCDICDREIIENHNLTRHMKNQHCNLWSCHRCNQSSNRCDNYEMHQRTCLFKTTGKRSGEHLGMTAKKLKDNVNCVGGALDGTLGEYRLELEGEQQDASNMLGVLKESTFQNENSISEEVARTKARKFYLSLHANVHLSTDEIFLINPHAVLNTDAIMP